MSKIRVIVQWTDYGAACHVGGPVDTSYRTFDVEAPELVEYMRSKKGDHSHRSITGIEILPDEREPDHG